MNTAPAPDLLALNAIKRNLSTLARTFWFTPKLPVLQQYNHVENFLTWSSRFKRFLKIGKYTLYENIIDLLLQNIDDTTVDKLEPVVEAMSPNERANPELFYPLWKQAMYLEATLIRSLAQKIVHQPLWSHWAVLERFSQWIERFRCTQNDNFPPRLWTWQRFWESCSCST